MLAGQWYRLGFSLGHLPRHEWRTNSLVRHCQLSGHCSLLDWLVRTAVGHFTLRWAEIEMTLFCQLPSSFSRMLLCFTGILAMIMIRTLRRDIARYNREDEMVWWLLTRAVFPCGCCPWINKFPDPNWLIQSLEVRPTLGPRTHSMPLYSPTYSPGRHGVDPWSYLMMCAFYTMSISRTTWLLFASLLR